MNKNEGYLIQFASNGVDVMSLLRKEYESNDELSLFFNDVFALVKENVDYLTYGHEYLPRAFLFEAWIKGEEPYTEDDKRLSPNNLNCVMIYHLMILKKMLVMGIDLEKLVRDCDGVVGHSVGLFSGVILALGCRADNFKTLMRQALRYMMCTTLRARKIFVDAMGKEFDVTVFGTATMLSLRNVSSSSLADIVREHNASTDLPREQVYVGLSNSADMTVLCSSPVGIHAIKERLLVKQIVTESDCIELESSEPYHSPWLKEVVSQQEDDREFIGFHYKGRDLQCPVISTLDGSSLQGSNDIFKDISELMCAIHLDWPHAIKSALKPSTKMVLDIGPGPLTKLFTQSYLRSCHSNIRQVSIDRKVPVQLLPMKVSQITSKYSCVEKSRVIKEIIRRNEMNAIVFAGQGTQRKGMGAELFGKYKSLVEQASDVVGVDIQALCVEDSKGLLNKTEYTQPAIYFVNAMWTMEQLRELTLSESTFTAGHSLGEYNALYAAGVFDVFDGLKIVKKRGELMSNCTPGAMASVMGMEKEKLEEIIALFGFDAVYVANINTPEQIVITGDIEQVKEIGPMLMASGAKNVVPLNTSGAFHSPFMKEAATEFSDFLQTIEFRKPKMQVIANVTAKPYGNEDIKSMLVQQMFSPVLWLDSMTYVLNNNISTVVELGESEILGRMFDVIKTDYDNSFNRGLDAMPSKVA